MLSAGYQTVGAAIDHCYPCHMGINTQSQWLEIGLTSNLSISCLNPACTFDGFPSLCHIHQSAEGVSLACILIWCKHLPHLKPLLELQGRMKFPDGEILTKYG
jgi:hypothetical protein